jgi:hypothetical protein
MPDKSSRVAFEVDVLNVFAGAVWVEFAHVLGVHYGFLPTERDHPAHVFVDEVRDVFSACITAVKLIDDVIGLVFGGLSNRG